MSLYNKYCGFSFENWMLLTDIALWFCVIPLEIMWHVMK